MAIILGVDPGLTRCGYALFDSAKNQAIAFGMFQSQPTSEPRDRVGAIAQELRNLVNQHQPEMVALERVFAQANLRSVMGVAQVSGALMSISFDAGIPLQFFTPSGDEQQDLAFMKSVYADKVGRYPNSAAPIQFWSPRS